MDVAREVGITRAIGSCVPIILLRSGHLYRSISGGKACKVCEIREAAASLESDVWKHFPATGNENGGKGDGEAKNREQIV